MNWDRIEGNWKTLSGKLRSEWGRLTDKDLAVIAGHREQLAGKLQQRYGIAREDAEQQLSHWHRKVDSDRTDPQSPKASS